MKADLKRLKDWVNYLVDFEPHRHFGNIQALNHIANQISESFNDLDLEVNRQSWSVRGNEYHNIIGSYLPDKNDRLIVGAHYDVYGNNPGADDNASGVAGLMETARIISELTTELNYGIDFVAYSLEEPPFFSTPEMGSYVHARSLSESQQNIIGMICYDMIGYFSDEPFSQNFPNEALAQLYPSTGNYILVVGCEDHADFAQQFYSTMRQDAEIGVELVIFPDAQDLGGLSDHRNYWHFGMDALMINNSAFLRNRNYHEKTDTPNTLDFKKMKAVVDASITSIISF